MRRSAASAAPTATPASRASTRSRAQRARRASSRSKSWPSSLRRAPEATTLSKGENDAQDLTSEAFTAKQIKNGTITGKQVKDNSLTGKQIDEGSLSQVPSAASAASAQSAGTAAHADHATDSDALSGVKIKQIRLAISKDDTESILSYGGFEVTGECTSGGKAALKMRNISGGNSIAAYNRFISGDVDPDHAYDSDFNNGNLIDLAAGGDKGTVEADLAADSGVTITGSAIWRDAMFTNECVISGRVTWK
jgi:hypothetical protein